jgi:hypothetical protein
MRLPHSSVSFSSAIFSPVLNLTNRPIMDAESSVSQRYWGPNKYGRERGLVLRDFTVGTRIVRPFTEAYEEFGPGLGGIINNVGGHGDL